MIVFTMDGSPSMSEGEGWLWWKVTKWERAFKAVKGFIATL
jgi:hypothetical protein